ncbi:hypothetical protein [Melittangium boletus]|uniref:hypothetical protein n=1 Tax=Melittangium boletus TaxID=83453 RepID=UPI001C54C2F7|nr:hypothetical protein [Melittangium boletus]
MRRDAEQELDAYYRSKILADREVDAALERHPDLHASLVLPGFMNGPGDSGPTTAGQLVHVDRARLPRAGGPWSPRPSSGCPDPPKRGCLRRRLRFPPLPHPESQ